MTMSSTSQPQEPHGRVPRLRAAAVTCTVLGGSFVAVALLAAPAYAAGSTLWVAEGGSDTGNGCTVAASPCATVTHALSVVTSAATINVTGTIHDSEIDVNAPVTITGVNAPSSSPAVLDGSGTHLVLNVTSPTTLDHLTITHGTGQNGGGVLTSADLTVTNSTVTGNSAHSGAGIYTSDDAGLTVRNSTISSNTVDSNGAGISAGGPVTITDSTISSNTAAAGVGGGLVGLSSQPMVVRNSLISGNSALQSGGIQSSNLTLTNSTVTGNAGSFGAGLWDADGTVTIIESAVYGNTGGEDVENDFGTLIAGGSIFGTCLVESGSTQTSRGYNIESGTACDWNTSTDLQSTAPQLGTLQDNGGPTWTRFPATTSPAINKIPTGTATPDGFRLCTRTDQRGAHGPSAPETKCTIGPVEAASGTSLTQPALSVTSTHGTIGLPLPLTTSGGAGAGAVTYGVDSGTASGCAVSSAAPYQLSSATLGTCIVTASKAGDPNYNPASSAPTTVTVAKPTTATTLHPSVSTAGYGHENAVHLGVTVTGAGPSKPTGKVTLTSGSTRLCIATLTSGQGSCSLAAIALHPGAHTIRAAFPGDANFQPSSTTHTIRITKASSKTTLTVTRSTLTCRHEQSERFTVTVASTYASGHVTVNAGKKRLCRITLRHRTGHCNLHATTLARGTHRITAHYTGNTNVSTSTSKARRVRVN